MRFPIPSGIKLEFQNPFLIVYGQVGSLKRDLSAYKQLSLKIDDNFIYVEPLISKISPHRIKQLCQQIKDDCLGVTRPYHIQLECHGLGYYWALKENTLYAQIGRSHEVQCEIPDKIRCVITSSTELSLISADKLSLGQFAHTICNLHPKDIYKGKGITQKGQRLDLKEKKRKS